MRGAGRGGCREGILVELRSGRQAKRNSLGERVNETIGGGGA